MSQFKPPQNPKHESADELLTLPIESISLSSFNPRRNFEPKALEELTESIRNQGVLQPILVRRVGARFEIVAGERRYRASVAAGLTQVPVIIKEYDDREMIQVALVENLQRENLNALEEAETYRKLIDQFGFTQETLAQSLGKDRTTISNTIRLLKLPREVQEKVREGVITAGHARAILGLPTADRQREFARMVIEKGMSVRELERLIQQERKQGRDKPLKPSYIQELEDRLASLLHTTVTVQERGRRGSIVIDYADIDEFERIFDILQEGAGNSPQNIIPLKSNNGDPG